MNAATSPAQEADQFQYTTPVALRWHDRIIAKLVAGQPGGELVLAMPFRNRETVQHVSVPPAVLAYARRAGARRWVVRFDRRGECYTLSLDEVERRGWLKPHRDGHMEWFVALAAFRPSPWLSWAFVTQWVDIESAADECLQLALFDADDGATGAQR